LIPVQFNVALVIEQADPSWLEIVHVPPTLGSGSENPTFVAAPAPAPFENTISNPIASPALTGPVGLAVFRICKSGQTTVTLAEPETIGC
jgi:hypothetical protein